MKEIARREENTSLERRRANEEALDEIREHPIAQALAEAVQGAREMDMRLATWADEYGFTRGPGESGSIFLARFCTYLAQMYHGMYNPEPIARICTCTEYIDVQNGLENAGHIIEHEFPCELSTEAYRRRPA